MKLKLLIITATIFFLIINCGKGTSNFSDDVKFLKKYSDAIVIKAPDSEGMVVIVPEYQGKVMTSSASGLEGQSFGWINYKLVKKRERQDHINIFGGEDRFWIGPEGGQFSVFFKKNDSQTMEYWQTPEPIDWGPWEVSKSEYSLVQLRKRFSLENHNGFIFNIKAERQVKVYSKNQIQSRLDITLDDQVKYVGYETDNSIQNVGDQDWTKKNGLLSIWILGMLKHSEKTTVVIPYKKDGKGPVVKDDYFGKVPADRLKDDGDGTLYFKGDGKKRTKIGVSKARARDIAGSYSMETGTLTIIKYSLPEKNLNYVNSMWTDDDGSVDPYKGDVINSYNDGPNDKGEVFGPFYELESSSPAFALKKGETGRHIHSTFHFQGDESRLNEISRSLLGVDLSTINSAF